MNNKIWPDTEAFLNFEKKASIKSEKAIEIYNENFEKNFKTKKDDDFIFYYRMILFVEENMYHIGYRSTQDKIGDKIAPLSFLAKINSETGEILVVK